MRPASLLFGLIAVATLSAGCQNAPAIPFLSPGLPTQWEPTDLPKTTAIDDAEIDDAAPAEGEW